VALDHARLPFRHERMEPLTRIERVTYRLRSSRSDRLSYRGLAAGQGFEPRSRGSGPRILPLDDPALVRKAGVEPGVDEFRARQVSRLPSLPRGAPPEARTPFSGLRVRCITRHACGAQSGMWESSPYFRLSLARRNRTSGLMPPKHVPYHSAMAQCRLAYFDHAAVLARTGLARRIVAGPSCRTFLSPGFLTR
jgi:hypothetical protein